MKKIFFLIPIFLFMVGLGANHLPTVWAQGNVDVEKAITAGDHKSLAQYYKSQAEAQRKIAEMHQKMKAEYRKTHVHYKGTENVLAGHCGNLEQEALKAAEQYDKMAQEEENLAGQK